MKNTLAVIILCFSTNANAADPFGVSKGTSLGDLDISNKGNSPNFTLNSVPKPHPLFTTYSIYATKDQGVCAISAISEVYADDKYGNNAKSDFGRIANALDAKYGDGQLLDRIFPSALWKETDEWVMSLKQNERFYISEWKKNDDNGLKSIEMSIKGISNDDSLLVLRYFFDNFEDCKLTVEGGQDSAL